MSTYNSSNTGGSGFLNSTPIGPVGPMGPMGPPGPPAPSKVIVNVQPVKVKPGEKLIVMIDEDNVTLIAQIVAQLREKLGDDVVLMFGKGALGIIEMEENV